MIDPEYVVASWFLWLSGVGFLLVYALPLTLAPLYWARVFRWHLPEGNNHLTLYFGRCTGVLALSVTLFAMRAAMDPEAHRYLFELITLICSGMTLLHLYGAVRRMQPWTEDAEVVLYAGIAAVSWWVLGTLPPG